MSKRINGEGSIFYRADRDRWVAKVNVNGKIKLIYAISQEEVLKKKKALESDLTTGSYIEPTDLTVKEFIRSWFDGVKFSLRDSTFLAYESIIKQHITPSIGAIELQKLHPSMIQGFYKSRVDMCLQARSIRNIHRVLHKALKQAVVYGYIKFNPATDVTLPRIKRTELNIWNQEQVNRFLKTAKSDRYYLLYLLALSTGMRQGELLGLKWNDINFDRATITVNRTLKEVNGKLILNEPKTTSSRRTILVPRNVINLLGECNKNTLYVFTDTSGGCIRCQNLVRRSFKPLIEKAGVPDIRFHDLRHTHATLLIQAGANIKAVSERLGHASIQITLDTYSHVTPSMQVDLMEKLDSINMV